MNLRPLPTKHKPAAGVKSAGTNPWSRLTRLGYTEVVDVTSRVEIVREASAEMLRQYIAWPGTQKTVLDAAKSRLSRLMKLEKGKI